MAKHFIIYVVILIIGFCCNNTEAEQERRITSKYDQMKVKCEEDTCKNQGECSLVEDEKDYTCKCPDTHAGKDCSIVKIKCGEDTCKNQGECSLIEDETDYTCKCPDTHAGKDCSKERLICESSICKNGGTCKLNEDMTERLCECPVTHTGKDCSEEVDNCTPNPCVNGGSCVSDRKGYRCVCTTKYSGQRCETVNAGSSLAVLLQKSSEMKVVAMKRGTGDLNREPFLDFMNHNSSLVSRLFAKLFENTD